ncbi:MAG: T9SS type A sorting domain-containing protein [Candidatus Eisenbacteria bacterium]|uniref:T9SS type A sorting domain-containing protein n=1 Tax=Eiseniibacteriota bacterium TaxID=2212470 RepID=A0A937XA90_UNCEI|nr:T9SS type A sorting domain-containing protein [Candidatus Eisenbacteria bacterium]
MRARSMLFSPALIVALLAGMAFSVSAFSPVDYNAVYEIPLPEYDLHTLGKSVAAQRDLPATGSLGARYGGTWRVYSWNPQTDTPAHLYGSGAQVAGPLTDGAQAEAAARHIVSTHPEVFGADPANLRFASAPTGMGKRTVHLQQTHHGIDVWLGGVYLTFLESGRLFVMGSTYYADIAVSPVPSLSAPQAERLAAGDLPFDPSTDSIEPGSRLLVLPVALSATEVEHRLVWRVRVHTEEPHGIWVTHVDAHSGEIVWRYNDVHFVNFTGDATIGRQEATYCNGEQVETCRYLRVQVSGVGSATTDIDGNWTVAYGGTDPRTVTSDLYGPYVDVNNYNGADAAFSGTATPGTPFTVAWSDANARQDERDVFDAVNDIHVFFLEFAPSFSYINQRITAYVNRSDGYCPGNAWWNGTINFCAAGGSYANTGEIQGVVHHEYGHGIQDAILGWQGGEGLGEGNSDIMANLITQESIIGRGFYQGNCTSGIRNSLNSLIYPDDVIGQPIHSAGRVIAGFHWDFMVSLQGQYGAEQGAILAGERWHFGRVLQHPTTQPAQVLATFIADDDDGNLENGTPHYAYLAQAAENHNYDYPEITVGVIITHTPLGSTEDEGPRAALATIYSTVGAIDEEQVFLRYRVNGGAFQQLELIPTGGADEYQATIPGQAQPAEIEYYLFAADELGNSKTHPPTAPAALHPYSVAWKVDAYEAESGWTVNLAGTDDATTGIWVREDPVGTIAQPEDDHTPPPGTHCWVTGNAAPGQPDGTNDIDGGKTTVYSPVYDLTGAVGAIAKYWRWYSNNMGNSPNADTWVTQVRNNGGAWVDIERNQTDQNQWAFRQADLEALFGANLGQVQFKFEASDLGAGSLVEAALDDFELLVDFGFSAVDGASADATPRFAFDGSRVNPTPGPAEIRFQVPAAVQAQLQLYDVTGRLVRTLLDGRVPAGPQAVAWDGGNEAGRPVGSGVYFLRLRAGDFQATRTLVVSR